MTEWQGVITAAPTAVFTAVWGRAIFADDLRWNGENWVIATSQADPLDFPAYTIAFFKSTTALYTGNVIDQVFWPSARWFSLGFLGISPR
jgi:hypothetical protein